MTACLRFLRSNLREAILLAIIIVLTALGAARSGAFLGAGNFRGLGLSAAVIFLIGIGEAGVIATRNIDASIGSMTGLVAYFSTYFLSHHPGIGGAGTIGLALAAGAVLGLVNGLLVARLKLPSILVTLGTLFIYLGLLYMIAGDNEVSTGGLPSSYRSAATGSLAGVPLICWYALILGVAAHLASRYTRSGRVWMAVGSNPAAARVLALRPEKTVIISYVLSGLCCGLAGGLWGSIYPTVDASVGSTVLLQVLAAVLVGGVSIWGGKGSAAGVALGSFLFTLLLSALIVLGVSPFWESAVAGAVIVITVSLNRDAVRALLSPVQGRRS